MVFVDALANGVMPNDVMPNDLMLDDAPSRRNAALQLASSRSSASPEAVDAAAEVASGSSASRFLASRFWTIRFWAKALLILGAWGWVLAAAAAETPPESDEELILESIVVEAEALPNADRTPVPSSSADAYHLAEGEAEAASWAVVLDSLGGVEVSRSGGPLSPLVLRMRGGQSADVLVLLDGVPLNTPSPFAVPRDGFGAGAAAGVAGGVDLNEIPLTDIARVEVIRGAAAAEYGAGAQAGVVLLHTRAAKRAGWTASIQANDIGGRSLHLQWRGFFADDPPDTPAEPPTGQTLNRKPSKPVRPSWTAAFSRRDSLEAYPYYDPRLATLGPAVGGSESTRCAPPLGDAGYRLRACQQLIRQQLSWEWRGRDQRGRVFLTQTDQYGLGSVSLPLPDGVLRQREGRVFWQRRRDLASGTNEQIRLHGSWGNLTYEENPQQPLAYRRQQEAQRLGAEGRWQGLWESLWESRQLRSTYGAGALTETLRSGDLDAGRQRFFVRGQFSSRSVSSRSPGLRSPDFHPSTAIEKNSAEEDSTEEASPWRFASALRLTASSDDAHHDETSSDKARSDEASSGVVPQWSWSTELSFPLRERWRLHLRAANGHRLPTLRQLYEPHSTLGPSAANADLRPERSVGGSIGLRHGEREAEEALRDNPQATASEESPAEAPTRSAARSAEDSVSQAEIAVADRAERAFKTCSRAELTLFQQDFDDRIVLAIAPQDNTRYRYQNIARSRSTGVEGVWQFCPFWRWWRVRLNASWLDARILESATQDQRERGKIVPGIAQDAGQLKLEWRPLTRGYAHLSLRHRGRRYLDALNARYLHAYQRWDAGMSWQMSTHWRLSLQLQNLSNAIYVDLENRPLPGRVLQLGLRWQQ